MDGTQSPFSTILLPAFLLSLQASLLHPYFSHPQSDRAGDSDAPPPPVLSSEPRPSLPFECEVASQLCARTLHSEASKPLGLRRPAERLLLPWKPGQALGEKPEGAIGG